jgi:glycosyltransferase involved in cell wall biosynthesis
MLGSPSGTTATGPPVRVMIMLPADPLSEKIGGIQTFVRDFISGAPPDFELGVVGVSADRAARPVGRWQQVELDGRRVAFLPVSSIGDVHRRARVPIALRYTLGLLRFRRRIPTRDAVLQFHRAGGPLAFLDRAGPMIQVVHLNVADIYGQAGESRWRRLPGLYHRVEDLTVGRMSRVFVVNEAGVDFYRRRHPAIAERFTFMPTWYDDTLFRPPTEATRSTLRRELAGELGFDQAADALVLFVGRLERQKDPELLIDAFVTALAREARLRLLIVGEGDLRAVAQAAAHRSGQRERIHFLGYRPRSAVAQLMAAADALLLASRFEGMPITVLEALASGLPVASTSVGEVPRVVRDGESGALATERTPAALAGALLSVLGGGDALRNGAVRAAAPYARGTVLGPLYQAHRDALLGRP